MAFDPRAAIPKDNGKDRFTSYPKKNKSQMDTVQICEVAVGIDRAQKAGSRGMVSVGDKPLRKI